jgi:cytochrome c
MATSGNNLQCVDCHAGEDHRVRGRGTDLSGTDSPANPLFCTSCHDPKPHGTQALDHHTDRLNCTVCHITEFAKTDQTDMRRDWSTVVRNDIANKYSAAITFGTNVQPVYAWFNGNTRLMKMGDEVRYNDDGSVTIMAPQGSRKDKNAKINAFKLHEGVVPVWEQKQWLIPLAVDEFFIDGDLDKAVRDGAHAAYGVDDLTYKWVETRRLMGIFHEVRPASKALRCLDCHREGGRMDWKALGYGQDPLLAHLK